MNPDTLIPEPAFVYDGEIVRRGLLVLDHCSADGDDFDEVRSIASEFQIILNGEDITTRCQSFALFSNRVIEARCITKPFRRGVYGEIQMETIIGTGRISQG